MAHENQNIPEFMIKYYQRSDHYGREDIAALAKEYEVERATFLQTTFVEKQLFQRDWIKLTGKGKPLTVDEALVPMNLIYEQRAKKIAEKSSYQEREKDQQTVKTTAAAPEDEREKILAQIKKMQAGNTGMQQQPKP